MRITFIGTSHGYPEQNRKCTCILIETKEKKYILDMGCNPLEYLTNIGIHIRDIDAAFISHVHGDHLNGIIPVTEVINWAFTDTKLKFYVPTLKVKNAINAWKALNNATLREDIPFLEIQEGIFYDDGVLKVTSFRNRHMDYSYSFLFEAEEKKVFFTGDLSKDGGKEYAEIADEKYDFVACEGAHFSPLDYKEAFINNPPDQIYFYHYVPMYVREILKLSEELKEIVPIKIATDGFVVEL